MEPRKKNAHAAPIAGRLMAESTYSLVYILPPSTKKGGAIWLMEFFTATHACTNETRALCFPALLRHLDGQ
jgi:hypothetical protein